MPAVDFRSRPFDISRMDASGKEIGRNVYWRIYAIENLVRVIIHTVLSAQIGPNWWTTAASPSIQHKERVRRARYQNNPWHSSPGGHGLYLVDLSDLTEIIRANRNLFVPVVVDIDAWIARFETIRIPRNIVGHMNWPSSTDRSRISVLHADVHALVGKMSTTGTGFIIP